MLSLGYQKFNWYFVQEIKWLNEMAMEAKYIILSDILLALKLEKKKQNFKYNLIMNITEECNTAHS